MKFPRITSNPAQWKTQYKAPKPAPMPDTAHRIKAQAGLRPMEQHVARQLYYEMARFSGVPNPPSFSSLYVQTQSMYVSMASTVIRFLETQIEE